MKMEDKTNSEHNPHSHRQINQIHNKIIYQAKTHNKNPKTQRNSGMKMKTQNMEIFKNFSFQPKN